MQMQKLCPSIAHEVLFNCSSFPFQEKIESATDVLKAILHPVMDEHEEISWPPRDPEALKLMEKVNIIIGFSQIGLTS